MSVPPILLVSELFPPDIGGSAVLFEGIYSRLPASSVTVLTQSHTSTVRARVVQNLHVLHDLSPTQRWGLLDPLALRQHMVAAARVRRVGLARRAIVHCGRALPEGVATWLSYLSGGPRYVCWAHGEDIATALTSREFTFLMKSVYRNAEAVFANSRHTRDLLERVGIAPQAIEMVYPGVDPDRFHPDVDGSDIRRKYAPRGETLLLSVGRFQRRKGHDLVIAALGALKHELPSLRYVVVGDGPERARLERLVNEHNVQDIVSFAGEVSADDLPSYYAAADIFLMPNRIHETDFEGFGIVFLEAAASGKPVIGGNSGGVPEAVEDGITGLLVGGTDANELAVTIRRLAEAPHLRRQMGHAGRARVIRAFTWMSAAHTVERAHRRVAERQGGGNRKVA